jgi:transposase InsO family protein
VDQYWKTNRMVQASNDVAAGVDDDEKDLSTNLTVQRLAKDAQQTQEMEAQLRSLQRKCVAVHRTTAVGDRNRKLLGTKLTKARQRAQQQAREQHEAAQRRVRHRREQLARDFQQAVSDKRQPRQSRLSRGMNLLSALVTTVMIAALWNPATAFIGARLGSHMGSRQYAQRMQYSEDEGRQRQDVRAYTATLLRDHGRPPDDGTPVDQLIEERYDAWVDKWVGRCYVTMANHKASGKTETMVEYPSRLRNTKKDCPHMWRMGETWKGKQALADMMDSYTNYSYGLHDLPENPFVEFDITLTDSKPIWQHPYRSSQKEAEWASEWTKEMIDNNIVGEIQSPYRAPVVVASKKDEITGNWTDFRMAVDYRRLNKVTERDSYPAPAVSEVLMRLHGATLFSSLDCSKAFHQIRTSENARKYLAFAGPGIYHNKLLTYNRMPYGPVNSPACWTRFIDRVLSNLSIPGEEEYNDHGQPSCGFIVYIDDICCYSSGVGPGAEERHMRVLKAVMDRLAEWQVYISPNKAHLGMQRMEYLGHVLTPEGIEPCESKIQAVVNLPDPSSVTELRSALGMATFYCSFLPHFSNVKSVLTRLTRKGVPWEWNEQHKTAWAEIKRLLTSAPVLKDPDWKRTFHLHIDFSTVGVASCISQVSDDGKHYAIGYASKMNNAAESNLSSYEGEALALITAVKRWDYILRGRRFVCHTDSKALTFLRDSSMLKGKIARWALRLAEYDFDIQHVPGKCNNVADHLSRYGLDESTTSPTPSLTYMACRPAVELGSTIHSAFYSSQGHSFWAVPMMTAFTAAYFNSIKPRMDLWEDDLAIMMVKGELVQETVPPQQWIYLRSKTRHYRWERGQLWMDLGGRWVIVPPPAERVGIVESTHLNIGHLGRDRTYSALQGKYFWPRMFATVRQCIQTCTACDRVRATFDFKHDDLKPLPLMALFYRYHIDTIVNLPAARDGSRHLVVVIEACSKWVEIVPVRDINSDATARVFRERVLSRVGNPVEVVSDNGSEYQGAFHRLLQSVGIDHRYITPGHPESNGAVERTNGAIKKALRKYIQDQSVLDWPQFIPTIEFGLRCTTHSTTGYSPFFLLHGHQVAGRHAGLHGETLDIDDPEAMLDFIQHRARVLQETMPLVFQRAVAQQQKDIHRYRKVRRRETTPRQRRFQPGDYVYVRQPMINTLDTAASRTILRVVEVRPQGKLRLEGADGLAYETTMCNVAPCNIPNLVTSADGVAADLPCEVCRSPSLADFMLLCDTCNKGFHLRCLQPPLSAVPDGDWFCPRCRPPAV